MVVLVLPPFAGASQMPYQEEQRRFLFDIFMLRHTVKVRWTSFA